MCRRAGWPRAMSGFAASLRHLNPLRDPHGKERALARVCGRCGARHRVALRADPLASLGEPWGPDADLRASSFETLA